MLHIISTCDITILRAARTSLCEGDEVVVFADILSDAATVDSVFAGYNASHLKILFAGAEEKTQAAFLAALSQPHQRIDLDTFVELSVKHACTITWQ